MVGRTSLTGVQRKISLGLSTDAVTMQIAVEPGPDVEFRLLHQSINSIML